MLTTVTDSATLPARPLRRPRIPWLRRALIFVTLVVLLDSVFGERGLLQTRRAGQDFARASQGLEKLKRDNAALRGEVRDLQQDPAAIEAIARAELGLIGPGEILVILKDLK